jgi:LCP family protein required for cell wall assembly
MSSGYGPRPSGEDVSRPSPPNRPRRRRAGRQPRGPLRDLRRERRFGPRSVLLLLLGFIVSGILGAGAYFVPSLVGLYSNTGVQSVVGNVGGPPAPGSPFTVLLLGSDDDAKFDPNHVLTQSMILLRVDPQAKSATMLSIPRDLWVPIGATGQNAKIDAAYSFGGSRAAIATVTQNFHVHIDDYVWVGLKGLVRLIDKVGGVDVITSNPVIDDFYPADLDSTNPYGYTRVAVLPGPQHLDGVNALKYVRSRHGDLRGDLGRSQRQQQVLIALRAKSKSLGIADIPDLASTFNGEFSTSITVDRFGSLLTLAKAFDAGSVKQIVLLPPYTSNAQIAGQDVLLPNWTQILPLVRSIFPS